MLNHNGTVEIETERLQLRKFKIEYINDMLKYWISDPNIQSMYGEPIYETKGDVEKLLSKYIDSYKKKDYYRWAIILKETGECIGQVAFFLVDSNNNFSEIEYCIGSRFHNKGLATEATNAVIQYGFNKINFHKIQISHKENNIPSKRVIEKCNFKFEGKLRDYFYVDGSYVSRLYYSILKGEWKNR